MDPHVLKYGYGSSIRTGLHLDPDPSDLKCPPASSYLALPLVLVDPLGHEPGLGLEHILAVPPVPHEYPAQDSPFCIHSCFVDNIIMCGICTGNRVQLPLI